MNSDGLDSDGFKKMVYANQQALVEDLRISKDGQVRKTSPGKRLLSIHVKDNQKHFERDSKRIPLRYALMETFVGPMAEDQEVEFIDGVKTNCYLSNLKYVKKGDKKAKKEAEGTNVVIIPPAMSDDQRLARIEQALSMLPLFFHIVSTLDDKMYAIMTHFDIKWSPPAKEEDGDEAKETGE